MSVSFDVVKNLWDEKNIVTHFHTHVDGSLAFSTKHLSECP